MTDDNDNIRQSPGVGGRAPLTLKPRPLGAVSSGTIKQSFSHGRSKTVVVETKRRVGVAPSPAAPRTPPVEVRPIAAPRGPAPAPEAVVSPSVGGLSPEEQRARLRVIELAKQQQLRVAAEREAAQARTDAEARAAAPAIAETAKLAAVPAPVPVAEQAPAPAVAPPAAEVSPPVAAAAEPAPPKPPEPASPPVAAPPPRPATPAPTRIVTPPTTPRPPERGGDVTRSVTPSQTRS